MRYPPRTHRFLLRAKAPLFLGSALSLTACATTPSTSNAPSVATTPGTTAAADAAPNDHAGAPATAAHAARARWLAAVDQSDRDEMWALMAPVMRQGLTPDKWLAAMKTIQRSFGRAEKRTLKLERRLDKLPNSAPGNYLLTQYQTTFS